MKATMQTWWRFWRLSAGERRIVVEACAALTASYIGLRMAGFQRWKTTVERLTPIEAGIARAATSVEFAPAIARMNAAAARHLFFRASCLEQSLALWCLLRRRNVPADLRIGARKQEQDFEAHAWIELDGVALNDPEDTHVHFSPFEGPATPMEAQTR